MRLPLPRPLSSHPPCAGSRRPVGLASSPAGREGVGNRKQGGGGAVGCCCPAPRASCSPRPALPSLPARPAPDACLHRHIALAVLVQRRVLGLARGHETAPVHKLAGEYGWGGSGGRQGGSGGRELGRHAINSWRPHHTTPRAGQHTSAAPTLPHLIHTPKVLPVVNKAEHDPQACALRLGHHHIQPAEHRLVILPRLDLWCARWARRRGVGEHT